MGAKIPILKLNIAGQPLRFINSHQAAVLYASDRVAWEAGTETFTMYGGISGSTGIRSEITINSIIAIRQHNEHMYVPPSRIPKLIKKTLWARDRICMYCGTQLSERSTTIEHIIPLSLGGDTSWTNCVAACYRCNNHRSNKPLESVGYSLLAVPYKPVSFAEYIALTASRYILFDQMQFLMQQFPSNSPLAERLGWE